MYTWSSLLLFVDDFVSFLYREDAIRQHSLCLLLLLVLFAHSIVRENVRTHDGRSSSSIYFLSLTLLVPPVSSCVGVTGVLFYSILSVNVQSKGKISLFWLNLSMNSKLSLVCSFNRYLCNHGGPSGFFLSSSSSDYRGCSLSFSQYLYINVRVVIRSSSSPSIDRCVDQTVLFCIIFKKSKGSMVRNVSCLISLQSTNCFEEFLFPFGDLREFFLRLFTSTGVGRTEGLRRTRSQIETPVTLLIDPIALISVESHPRIGPIVVRRVSTRLG